jgi:hypothetical protein
MTPDLLRLREKWSELAAVLERLELELVDDPAQAAPPEGATLTDADRENPEVIAQLAAIEGTNRLITWFGRDREGYVGLWRGVEDLPLPEAPVVRLDRRGRYSIVAATVPDYLAISTPEDEFAKARDALARAGFQVSMNPDAIWAALDGFEDPNVVRDQAAGLARELGAAIDDFEQAFETDDPEELAAVAEPVARRRSGPIEVVVSGHTANEILSHGERGSNIVTLSSSSEAYVGTEAANTKPARAEPANAKMAKPRPAKVEPTNAKTPKRRRAGAMAKPAKPKRATGKAKAKPAKAKPALAKHTAAKTSRRGPKQPSSKRK